MVVEERLVLPPILELLPERVEVIVTQYIRLAIQAIQSSVCKAEAPKNGFQKMGDQKIESLCVSWGSLLLAVFLFG